MVLTQRRETESGWCQHRGGRHRLDGANTEVEDTDWMVLTQRWETEIEWCYIDWMVLTQRWET